MVRDPSFYAAVFTLHERLVAGDPTLLGDIASLVYEPLSRQLRSDFPQHANPLADDHLICEKIADALLDYGRSPQAANASTGAGVVGFLALRAKSRIQNGLRAERTRQRLEGRFAHGLGPGKSNETTNAVELSRSAGEHSSTSAMQLASGSTSAYQTQVDDSDDELAGRRNAVLSAAHSDQDRRLLELMLDGVRKTAVYAAVLGVGHLPLVEQRKIVKQHKDRLKVSATRTQERKLNAPKRRGRPPRRGGDRDD